MKIQRIATTPTGESYLDTRDWPLTSEKYCDSPDGYTITDAMAATGARLIRTPAGFVDDWHPVPDRMISVLLSGELRVETSRDTGLLRAGEMILCDDIFGQGHKMNEVDGRAYDMLLVTLPSNDR